MKLLSLGLKAALMVGVSAIPMKAIADSDLASESLPLTASQRFGYAQLCYKANSSDQTEFNKRAADLEAEGWKVDFLVGTTGTAATQVKSTMGLMAYRGSQVVIATKGTQSLNDWKTNVRSSRHGLSQRAFHSLMGLFTNYYNNKEAIIAAQHIGLAGEVHNGFLQTHLSMWDQVKQNLKNYVEKEDLTYQDLSIETLGHSLGGALQDLNQAHLLQDSTLGLGVQTLESSFVDTDLDMSGFYGLKLAERKANDNVRGTAFEAARAFTTAVAKEFNGVVGAGNSPHVDNRGDIVPALPFTIVGYKSAGDQVGIDTNHFHPLMAHKLRGVKAEAIEALNDFDKGISNKRPSLAKAFWNRATDTAKTVASKVVAAANTAVKALKNTGSRIASWFGY
ncbi:MAG: hypothetical protein ABFQ95_04165 [Pseudomonadota bacterium]